MKWLKGLFAAFIGGAANAITVIVVDPVAFNFGEQWKKTVTAALVAGIIAGAMYLKQAPLPDGEPPAPSSGLGGTRSAFSILLLALLSIGALSQTACWGGAQATRTRKIIEQLDNNVLAARESQIALSQLLSLKLIQPSTAQGIGSKVEAFRAANKQVIDFFDQPGFKTVAEDGRVTITLNPANKEQAKALVNTLIQAGQAIVNDKNLFPNISPESRAAFSALFAAAGSTAQSLLDLVNSLKATATKTTSISIPSADWRAFEHAKGVQFGY